MKHTKGETFRAIQLWMAAWICEGENHAKKLAWVKWVDP